MAERAKLCRGGSGRYVMRIERLPDNPIIRPGMDSRMDTPDGPNVDGPCLLRVPSWVPNPLGRYYLYFAHHHGDYVRLAYSDSLAGPWRTHEPGVLPLSESFFDDHIASPDVHADDERREIRLYYHGKDKSKSPQLTRVAVSKDGLNFTAREEILGDFYMRLFCMDGYHYGMAMPGILYRSRDPVSGFERGPTLFNPNMRHAALVLRDRTLHVFYSNVGECPEGIRYCTVDVGRPWTEWRETPSEIVLKPETAYEGADVDMGPSQRGPVFGRAHQLRDPYVFQEEGRSYLLYSVAGESGIGIAEIKDWL